MALRLSTLVWAGLRLGASASVLALAATSAHAQEVTGTIRGDVQDENGAPLAGATVTVTHVPSGTRSVQTTDNSGSFSAPNLRIGGPFDVTVAAPGFEGAKATVPLIQAGVP
ncbi:MAG: carboxypeptidase-like regulatory domain-containing protein, partial [Sandaracinobacter sp.]